MEPNKISTVNDLHNEGVDIMGDAGADQDGVAQVPVQMPAPAPVQPIAQPFIAPTPIVSTQQPAQTIVQPPSSSAQDEINRTLGIQTPTAQATVPNIQNDPSIKSVRTFKSDAEEAIRYGNVSATKISLAEQNKKQARELAHGPASQENAGGVSKAIVFATLFIFIALAGGGAYYLKQKKNPTATLPQGLKIESVIPYTKASVVQFDGQTNQIDAIATAIKSTVMEPGGTYALVPVPFGTTTMMAGIGDILDDTQAPAMLKRSLGTRYMFGAYFQDIKLPFIILKNTYFQNAFAGILEWEKNMREDLISIVRISSPNEITSLANSGTFEDSVISNIDARVLKNLAGQVVLAYAFSDKDTIVIATRTEALKVILDKLLAVRVVQ